MVTIKTCMVGLWLFSVTGGEPLEEAAMKAFHGERLEQAVVLMKLASKQGRKRRESSGAYAARRGRLAYLRGRIALRQQRSKEAIRWFQKALKKPTLYNRYILRYLVRAYVQAKRWKAAVQLAATLETKWKDHETKFEMRRAMASALEQDGRWQKLITLLKKMLLHPRAYGGRATVLWRMTQAHVKWRKWKSAQSWAEKLQLEFPFSSQAKAAYKLQERWAQKRKMRVPKWTANEKMRRLNRMISQRPEEVVTQLKQRLARLQKQRRKNPKQLYLTERMLARCLMRMNLFSEAVPIWERLLRKTGSEELRSKTLQQLGKAYVEAGMHKQALQLLHRFAEAAPESAVAETAAQKSIWMAMRMQKYARARRLLDEYVQVYPDSRWRVMVAWYKTWALFRGGNYKQAAIAFRSLGRKYPRVFLGRKLSYWMARSYERIGQWSTAKKLLVSVVKSKPFSYYGIMAQHRLFLLDEKLQHLAGASACAWNSLSKQRTIKMRSTAFLKPKKKKRSFLSEVLDEGVFGVSNAWKTSVAEDSTTSQAWKDAPIQLFAKAKRKKKVSFPKAPKLCRKQPNSEPCKGYRRAKFFHKFGFHKDAVPELYKAEKLLLADQKLLISSIYWFFSVNAAHQALRLSLGMKKKTQKSDWKRIHRLLYPRAYAKLMRIHSQRYRVPYALGWAIMREESHFRSVSKSWVGARGLMQIMPYTGRKIAKRMKMKEFRVQSLYMPEMNVQMGCWYLSQLLQKFEGNVMLVAASYNAGPHRVASWLKQQQDLDADEFVEEIPFHETRNYVKKVFRSYILYNFLYRNKLPPHPGAVSVKIGDNINF